MYVSPISPHIDQTTPTSLILDPRSGVPACNNLRTVISIIWSCLGTIFLCTWVAIHPNISVPRRKGVSGVLHRLKILSTAVIAPEFIIMWATRQYYAANRVAERYRARGWTRTHGFFFAMGGFHLYDGRTPLYPLSPDDLDDLVQRGIVDFPDITEGEIEDKGNGDALSKALVVLQSCWFILQCIARGAAHHPITELEIMTLAFALLNLVVYVFWWRKPLNVDHPFRVMKKDSGDGIDVDHSMLESEGNNDEMELLTLPKRLSIQQEQRNFVKDTFEYVIFGGGDNFQLSKEKTVPTFYAGSRITYDGTYFGISLVGVLFGVVFGGIHCFALFFQFPTRTEQIMWRVSSIAVVTSPVLMLVVPLLIASCLIWMDFDPDIAVLVIMAFFLFIYVVARLLLIAIAFTSIRSLPHSALEAVRWTYFIPHL